MNNIPDSRTDTPSALAHAGVFLLVPIALLLLLPLLFLFIVVLHLLALFYGAKVIVSGGTILHERADHEMQEPHFIKVKVRETKALTDESGPPVS